MNTLHVRSIPEDLYQRLHRLAQRRNRSLSAQVVEMLARSLEEEELQKEQVQALSAIRRRRFTPPTEAPSSLDRLKDDRKR